MQAGSGLSLWISVALLPRRPVAVILNDGPQ
jgi:hypothetical protein